MDKLWYLAIVPGCFVIVWFFIYLKRRQDEMEAEFQRRFADKEIILMDKNAMFVAIASDGYSQTQGVACLVLTDDELYFERRIVRKVLEIPVTSILSVCKGRRLKGKGTLRAMLKIEFRDEQGQKDTIGLIVKDLDKWIVALGHLPHVTLSA